MLPLAGLRARVQRRRDRLGRGDGRRLVGNDRAHHARLAGRVVGLDVGQPAQRLDHRIVDPLARIGTGFAEAADRNEDDVGPEFADDIFAQPHPLDRARTEVLHQHVGGRGELPDGGKALRALDIERQAAFAPVARQE